MRSITVVVDQVKCNLRPRCARLAPCSLIRPVT